MISPLALGRDAITSAAPQHTSPPMMHNFASARRDFAGLDAAAGGC